MSVDDIMGAVAESENNNCIGYVQNFGGGHEPDNFSTVEELADVLSHELNIDEVLAC